MKNNTVKPKAGVFMLSSEWFWNDGGIQNLFPDLPKKLEKDVKKITSKLSANLDIIHAGLITSKKQIDALARKVMDNNVDLILIVCVTWCDDSLLFAVLDAIPEQIPVLMWCYVPSKKLPEDISSGELIRRSGPVGALQFSGPMRRMKRKFQFVIGSPDDKDTIKDIKEWSETLKLTRLLKNSTIGVLPYRCGYMTGTYTDEFRLMNEIGPKLKYISVAEYASVVDSIKDAEVKQYISMLKGKYKVIDVSEKSLHRASKVSLGLAKLAINYNLNGVAIDDLSDELHNVLRLRPCLFTEDLFNRVVVTMEADISACVAMLILKHLAKQSPMFTEFFTFDLEKNIVLAGHAGIHDVRLADKQKNVRIVPDYEYAGAKELEGAWMEFSAKSGKLTIVSLVDAKDKFQMIVTTGRSQPGTFYLKGYPHMNIKLDTSIKDFYAICTRAGITQHFAVAYGDHISQLRKLAEVLDLGFCVCLGFRV
ncbi:MAG: hypothetical protein Q7J67_07980 [bacterium]|nr:hypothetical protein [bacterium]